MRLLRQFSATKLKHKTLQANKNNTLKKRLRGKSHLFAYLRFCAFCARKEKKIKNRKKSPQYNVNVLALLGGPTYVCVKSFSKKIKSLKIP